MTLALEWSKQDEFRSKPLNVWSIANGEVSGLTRSGGGLTYATIAGAGHMVCNFPDCFDWTMQS